MGNTTLPGASTAMPGTSMRMPTSRSVPIRMARSAVDLQLEVLQDRLGAARGGHAGGRLEGVQQLLAIASDFHGSVLPFCESCAVFSAL